MSPSASVVPDRLVAGGDRLGWQHDAVITGAPGHTPGHVAAWLEEHRVLVAGDALASHDGRSMLGAFNADPTAAVATARRLATLAAEVASSGTASRCAATRPPGSPSSSVADSATRAARSRLRCGARRRATDDSSPVLALRRRSEVSHDGVAPKECSPAHRSFDPSAGRPRQATA
jgi:hypothetical protein